MTGIAPAGPPDVTVREWIILVEKGGKQQTLYGCLVPALMPPSMSCRLLYHNIPFFLSSSFPHKVFHTGSRDLKDQQFWEVQGLPQKEGNLWKIKGRQQTLPWDQQSPRSCAKLKERGQRCGKEPQVQGQAAF